MCIMKQPISTEGMYYFSHSKITTTMDLQKSTDVALSFTKHLFSKEDYQNKSIVFSPLSLQVVLSVMAAGSEGSTLDELLSFLGSDSIDGLSPFFSHLISAVVSDAAAPSHRLSFANGMWADKSVSLSHSFKQLVATHYKATLGSVDFQNKGDKVRRKVNSWVEKETNGLITELLPRAAVNKRTRLIFANALHFKGAWEHKFDGRTIDSNFYLLNRTSVKVPFMTSEKEEQCIRAFNGFKVLRLPYKKGSDKSRLFSMYIFLPNAEDGLSALIKKLASESDFLKDKLLPQQDEMPVSRFRIPKFKFSFALEASSVLKELGVVSPFSQRDADFTKMVEVNSHSDKLHVESIFHKAFIEVNEEYTEAAAATSYMSQCFGCASPSGIEFVADHPFLFLIREDLTGTILFIGQMLNPLDGEATQTLKEDLEQKKQRKKKRSSEFKSEKNLQKKKSSDDSDDDKSEVPPKRKRSSKDDR